MLFPDQSPVAALPVDEVLVTKSDNSESDKNPAQKHKSSIINSSSGHYSPVSAVNSRRCDKPLSPIIVDDPNDHGQSGHSRSGSFVHSFDSPLSNLVVSTSTSRPTPSRSPIRTHGPMLLPKIRSQDQDVVPIAVPQPQTRPSKRGRTSPAPSLLPNRSVCHPIHQRSYTNRETTNYNSTPVVSAAWFPSTLPEEFDCSLLCSPVMFTDAELTQATRTTAIDSRAQRASSCNLGQVTVEKYNFPSYSQMPFVQDAEPPTPKAGSPRPTPQATQAMLPVSTPACLCGSSPMAPAASLTPEPQPIEPVQVLQPSALAPAPTTTLLNYLTTSNPAPSLVHYIAFPLRDPHIKHFWWDVRQVRPWTSFNTSTIMSLAGGAASSVLTCPESFLPSPMSSQRHPETELVLHSIYANWYLPKLNAALALSSNRPVQLSVPSKSGPHATKDTEQMFVVTMAGDASSAAAILGGKPSARVVGLVKSFDRFNTSMSVGGNVKMVEYLKGLAHLHYVMREHSCRYGFILTEIELVVVRNGVEDTPHFGFVEVMSSQLSTTASDTIDPTKKDGGNDTSSSVPMAACLALWGLCMLASDEPLPKGHAPARSEIGAPAEGTRRKALPRDTWMPQPQLAEKREAKRSRGWVFPKDAVGRKELGKRGVRYGGAC
ncbi:hypothetical protein F5883DRAFT_426728 [Diaporthe sp. PMI_573]|nr:hypothetical protein F5883DRAFT_426728 [Diaporthaceae sp. PMI_573]